MYQGRPPQQPGQGANVDAHMHPSAIFLPSHVMAAHQHKPAAPDPQCTYSSSRSSPSPITIMPRVAPGRVSESTTWLKNKKDWDEIGEALWKWVQEIRLSGRHGQFDLGRRFSLSLSLSLSPSLRPFPKSPVVVSQTAAVSAQTTDREKPGRVSKCWRKTGGRARGRRREERKTSFDFLTSAVGGRTRPKRGSGEAGQAGRQAARLLN